MSDPLLVFQCCEHCQYTDPHDLPHKEACNHGCNDAEMANACGWESIHALYHVDGITNDVCEHCKADMDRDPAVRVDGSHYA